jgi:hypothetical protein
MAEGVAHAGDRAGCEATPIFCGPTKEICSMSSVPDSQKAYSMTDPLRTSAGLHRRLNLFKSGPFGSIFNVFYPIS